MPRKVFDWTEAEIAKQDELARAASEAIDRRQKAHHCKVLADQLGPRYRPGVATLDSFETKHRGQKECVARLRKLAPELGLMTSEGRGFVFFGSVGTGKDHLAAAMLYIAAGGHGLSSHWVSGQEIYGKFRDQMETSTREADLLYRYVEPTILCISDPSPPSGSLSTWNVQTLYRLVDARYHAMRPTWLTLNVASKEEADKMLTAPVFDRIRDQAEFVPCFWPSYRRERR